jgi:Glutaminase
MPNLNAIVALIARIDPSVEKLSPAEAFRAHPDGFSIVFEGDQTARLYPGERAAALLQILEGLRRLRAPAYVEVDPQTRGITGLLIPLVTRIARLVEDAAEGVRVELVASHARHLLRRNGPDFGSLLEALRNALAKNAPLLVTETDSHEIIDARPTSLEPGISGPVRVEGKPARNWFRRFFCRCFCWFCCISLKRAEQLFNLCSATTCDPLTVPPPCIPFLYPDDGCWARASEMCRLMIAAGANPRKVWISGSLHVNTKNNPSCQVFWGWHVAPTLCVRRWFCRTEDMVIDPSLFTGPVSEATWKGVQGDPNATLTPSGASDYFWGQTDPGYVDTDAKLQYYRLQLQTRSLQVGPPPYAFCP